MGMKSPRAQSGAPQGAGSSGHALSSQLYLHPPFQLQNPQTSKPNPAYICVSSSWGFWRLLYPNLTPEWKPLFLPR